LIGAFSQNQEGGSCQLLNLLFTTTVKGGIMENWACSRGGRCKALSTVLTGDNFRRRPTRPLAVQYYRMCNECRGKPPCPVEGENTSTLRRCSFCNEDRALLDFVDADGKQSCDLTNGQVQRRQIVDFVKFKWETEGLCLRWIRRFLLWTLVARSNVEELVHVLLVLAVLYVLEDAHDTLILHPISIYPEDVKERTTSHRKWFEILLILTAGCMQSATNAAGIAHVLVFIRYCLCRPKKMKIGPPSLFNL